MHDNMVSTLPPQLERPDVRAAIVTAATKAYEASVDRYDQAIGDDNMLFGQMVWKAVSYFLKDELANLPDCRAVYVNQSLAIQVGRAHLRHHKLGNSEQDDPEHSFPNHPGPASRLGPEQLELNLPAGAGKPDVFLGWVIGTYGNPEDGLRRIYFQAVGSQRALDGTISRWEEIVPLYEAPSDGEGETMKKKEIKAEPVIAPEPEVDLRGEDEEAEADQPDR
jgi:hypothetical protein